MEGPVVASEKGKERLRHKEECGGGGHSGGGGRSSWDPTVTRWPCWGPVRVEFSEVNEWTSQCRRTFIVVPCIRVLDPNPTPVETPDNNSVIVISDFHGHYPKNPTSVRRPPSLTCGPGLEGRRCETYLGPYHLGGPSEDLDLGPPFRPARAPPIDRESGAGAFPTRDGCNCRSRDDSDVVKGPSSFDLVL